MIVSLNFIDLTYCHFFNLTISYYIKINLLFSSSFSSPVDRKDDRRGGRGGDRQDRGRGRSGGPGTSGTKGSSRRAPPERRIFVSNIPFEMKWQEIKDMFR